MYYEKQQIKYDVMPSKLYFIYTNVLHCYAYISKSTKQQNSLVHSFELNAKKTNNYPTMKI